jgi:hypothetical protein
MTKEEWNAGLSQESYPPRFAAVDDCIEVIRRYEDELYEEIRGTAPQSAKYTPLFTEVKKRLLKLKDKP